MRLALFGQQEGFGGLRRLRCASRLLLCERVRWCGLLYRSIYAACTVEKRVGLLLVASTTEFLSIYLYNGSVLLERYRCGDDDDGFFVDGIARWFERGSTAGWCFFYGGESRPAGLCQCAAGGCGDVSAKNNPHLKLVWYRGHRWLIIHHRH